MDITEDTNVQDGKTTMASQTANVGYPTSVNHTKGTNDDDENTRESPDQTSVHRHKTSDEQQQRVPATKRKTNRIDSFSDEDSEDDSKSSTDLTAAMRDQRFLKLLKQYDAVKAHVLESEKQTQPRIPDKEPSTRGPSHERTHKDKEPEIIWLVVRTMLMILLAYFAFHLTFTMAEDIKGAIKGKTLPFSLCQATFGLYGCAQVDLREASLSLLYSPELKASSAEILTLGMLTDANAVRRFVSGFSNLYVTCRHALVRLNDLPSFSRQASAYENSALWATKGSLSTDESRPYFCANHVFDNLKENYEDQKQAYRRRRREAWESLRQTTADMPSDPNAMVEQMLHALYYKMSAYTTPENTPPGSNGGDKMQVSEDPYSEIGYTTHMVFARDPTAFADPKKHDSHTMFAVSYADLVTIGVDTMETQRDCLLRHNLDEKERRKRKQASALDDDTSVAIPRTSGSCICGPHLGMGRSIAIASTDRKASVFIEPDIYSMEFDRTDDELAIVENPDAMQRGCGLPNWIRDIDANLRASLNVSSHREDPSVSASMKLHFAPSIVVQYIPLRKREEDGQIVADQSVTLKRVTGYESRCVQYCSMLASKLGYLGAQAYNSQTII